jgi:hypothetical protein
MMPGAGGDVNTTLPLVLAIVQLTLCGCGMGLGIPALIFAIMAGSAKKTGDLESARKKAKISIILFIVGTVLTILVCILSAVLGAFSA